jgi:pimeloyl-ACP methyl ester carboxylesterase
MALQVALLSRPYRVPAEPFQTKTEDGVRLVGHKLGEGDVALVFCHGFLGWHRKPRLVPFQEQLARRFSVYAFDLRGHGRSGGRSTFGLDEIHDIEAIVRLARRDGHARVVTFGGSMGGIAVIRHAALVGGVDGVVSVSSPARWDGHDSEAVRRMVWLTGSPAGRWLLRAGGVRVSTNWEGGPDPVDIVDRIAPIPLLIVHGKDDHFFDEEQAWLLYRHAREPKRMLLAARFGHAEDGYSNVFAEQVANEVLGTMLEPQP